jgi:hypothetical protein
MGIENPSQGEIILEDNSEEELKIKNEFDDEINIDAEININKIRNDLANTELDNDKLDKFFDDHNPLKKVLNSWDLKEKTGEIIELTSEESDILFSGDDEKQLKLMKEKNIPDKGPFKIKVNGVFHEVINGREGVDESMNFITSEMASILNEKYFDNKNEITKEDIFEQYESFINKQEAKTNSRAVLEIQPKNHDAASEVIVAGARLAVEELENYKDHSNKDEIDKKVRKIASEVGEHRISELIKKI